MKKYSKYKKAENDYDFKSIHYLCVVYVWRVINVVYLLNRSNVRMTVADISKHNYIQTSGFLAFTCARRVLQVQNLSTTNANSYHLHRAVKKQDVDHIIDDSMVYIKQPYTTARVK